MVGQATVARGGATAVAGGARPGAFVSPPLGLVAAPSIGITRSAAIAIGARQGPAGPAGTDHGYIAYREAASVPPITLLPDVRQQLTFSAALTNGILPTSPFADHVFWDGFRVQARKAGDTAIVRLDLTSTAFVAGGSLEIQVDIGGALGVIQTVSRSLRKPAGQAELLSEAFPVYVGATFLADGGALYLMSSVPTEISAIGLVIFPLSAAP